MKTLFSSVLSRFKKSAQSGVQAPRNKQVPLRLEDLEARELMSATMPAAPSFSTTAISRTQIDVSWKPVAGATSYNFDLYYSGAWHMWSYSSSVTNLTVNNLTPGTLYHFDVAAVNSAGTHWAAAPKEAITLYNPSSSVAYSPAPAGTPLWGVNGPSALDVRQGAEGDCWLISSLAEVAARKPQDIKSMFMYDGTTVENGQTVGLFSVRFFNNQGQAEWITVDTELPGGGAYYDHVTNYLGTRTLWVALAEKAYAEANGLGYVTSSNPGVDSYDALNGGWAYWALHAITDLPGSNYNVTASNLVNAWKAGDFIVLGSDGTPSSQHVVENHAYAVIGYNAANGNFELLNPWGATRSGYEPNSNYYAMFWANVPYLQQNYAEASINYSAPTNLFTPPATADEIFQTTNQSIEPKSNLGDDLKPNLQLTVAANWAQLAGTDCTSQDAGMSYSFRLN